MNKAQFAKINYIYVLLLSALVILIILFSKSIWIAFILGLATLGIMGTIVVGHLKLTRASSLIDRLYEKEKKRDFSIAPQLLGDILRDSPGTKSLQKKAAEHLSMRFQMIKLAVFFRYKNSYEVKIFYNINPKLINRPRIERLRHILKEVPGSGKILKDDSIGRLLLNEKALEEFNSPSVFVYNWGRSRSVIIICDDPHRHFASVLSDDEFNRILWPSLDELIRLNDRGKKIDLELKKLKNDYSRSKRDLVNAGKEVNRRSSELNSFVDISSDLYSILDENQLFSTLRTIISSQIGASGVEMLYPTGEGRYIIDRISEDVDSGYDSMVLEADSELYEMILKKSKPLLLPLAASVLKAEDRFLKPAIKRGFQLISPLGIGNEVGCLLLIGEKRNKNQYDDSDINFISVITNIASLSLANIRQFATIERLSYTDSMTGIFNYRYFYKRLGEEILRAKRYNRELSLVILDIDNFKLFNDNYGHQTGDMVLKSTAELITKAIRSIDIVSRYGGEEFCIIMPDTGKNSGRVFIERLRNEIAEFKFKSRTIAEEMSITVSVGGSVFPHHATTPDRLIYCADMALLKAKSLGRNKAIMFESDLAESESLLREDEL
ncbi:MAG: diguanylate cyclase [Candidatus Zixiibacteriota bacterium]|nr:MAG: diguanylate cyclase [candidate division Zixibacteria bacterium]